MSSSKFDIVVYGATGFTGQLVAEYLAAAYGGDANLKWAMAGRSKDKLATVRDAIGAPADTPLIVADAGDPASLKAMVAQTRAVITTVGPYQFYGNDVLAACVEAGVDYFDLCGEPLWMRQMIDKHEAAAKASGARIVFSCGFDSVPFELGALFVQEEARRVFGAPSHTVPSGNAATWQSPHVSWTWVGSTEPRLKPTGKSSAGSGIKPNLLY